MKRLPVIIAALLIAAPAFAQEPVGCDKFKWSVDKERALLANPGAAKVASGAQIETPLANAMTVALVPYTVVLLCFIMGLPSCRWTRSASRRIRRPTPVS